MADERLRGTEKTKIFGKIHYDVRVEPRNIQEEERLLARQLFDADNAKSKLQIISRNSASSILNPGTGAAASWGGSFIVRSFLAPSLYFRHLPLHFFFSVLFLF